MLAKLMDKFDERQLRLVAGGALLLVTALLFTYVLLPSIKAYRQDVAALQILEQVAVQGQDIGMQLERAAEEVSALNRELNGDMANLPENELEAFVVGRLQTISWRNDVELQSIAPRSGDRTQDFVESLFDVELNGNYFDLFAWLGEIKNELGFIVIKEYQMRPLEDVAADPRLSVRLTIASYRLSGS